MRKYLISLLLLLYSGLGFLYSQRTTPNTEKGIFFIKGGTSGHLTFSEGNPFTIEIGGGYFPVQNVLVGADLGFQKAGPFSDFYARPFARYYAFQRIFGGIGLSASQFASEKTLYIPEIEAGFALFLDSSLAFEPTFHYPIRENTPPYLTLNVSIFFSRF
jgi:hypothetical protein